MSEAKGDMNLKRLEIVLDIVADIEVLCEARGGSRDELDVALEKIDKKATTARWVLGEAIDRWEMVDE